MREVGNDVLLEVGVNCNEQEVEAEGVMVMVGDGKEWVEEVREMLVVESAQRTGVVVEVVLYMEVEMGVVVNGQEEGENKQECVGAVVINMDKLEAVVNEEAAVSVVVEVGNFGVVVVSCSNMGLVVVERTMEVAVVVNLVEEEVGTAHNK